MKLIDFLRDQPQELAFLQSFASYWKVFLQFHPQILSIADHRPCSTTGLQVPLSAAFSPIVRHSHSRLCLGRSSWPSISLKVSPVPRTPVNILVRFLSLYHCSSYLYFFYMHVLNLSHLKWNSHAQLQIHVLSGVMPPSSVQLPHEETRQSGSTFSCSHGPHIQSMAQSSSTQYSLCHYPGHRLHHLIWMMIS